MTIINPHAGSLCDCRHPEHQHNMCESCGATFTMKGYANFGDDLTVGCPICRVLTEAKITGENKQ